MSTWYVATDGAGVVGSIGAPFALSYARTGAGGSIVAGDTVYLRGGNYPPTDFTISGSSGSPITFQSYPGEMAVITGEVSAFRPASTWELYDAPTHTYRTDYTVSSNEYYGHIKVGTTWYPLALHQGALTALMASSQDFVGASNSFYLGPGITARDVSTRIYIRIEQPDAAVQVGHTNPTFSSNNPSDYEIVLTYRDSTGIRFSGSWLVFDGLTVRHSYAALYSGGGNDIVFKNMTVDRFSYAALVTYPSVRVSVDNISVDGNMYATSWWVAWEDIKNGNTPADHNRAAGIVTAVGENMSIINSRIENVFDGILGGSNGFTITDSTWKCWDDLYQMDNSAANIEIGRCYILGAGPSHDASSSSTPSPDPGKIYIHHNVIDPTAYLVFWGRRGSTTEGMRESIPFPTHGALGGSSYAQPWHVYHNTVKSGNTYTTNSQVGPGYYATTAGNQYTGTKRHDVFNNIFISLGEHKCYDIADSDDGTMVFDGNVYSGWSITTAWPIWPYVNGSTGVIPMFPPSGKGYSAALFRTSQAHTDSLVYYAAGWENSGLDADPDLTAAYVPRNTTVHTGAVNLTATGWPGTSSYEAFRGAFSPTVPGSTAYKGRSLGVSASA